MIYKKIDNIVTLCKQSIEHHIWLPHHKQHIALHILTRFLSWIYKSLWFLKSAAQTFQRPHKLPGITVSVGNLTVGGSGKSPTVIWLTKALQKKGYRVVVLTRGYGSHIHNHEYVWFNKGHLHKSRNRLNLVCDEPIMISKQADTDVVVGINRFKAAQWFLRFHKAPDIWILDDGYQKQSLERQINILLVDAEKQCGNNSLLPLGPLREPLSARNRATHILFTRDQTPSLEKTWFGQPVFSVSSDIQILSLKPTKTTPKKTICIASGIAQPDRLQTQLLEKVATQDVTTYFVGDHEPFHLEHLKKEAGDRDIYTTWKDYYRQPEMFQNIPNMIYIVDLLWKVSSENEDAIMKSLLNKRTRIND